MDPCEACIFKLTFAAQTNIAAQFTVSFHLQGDFLSVFSLYFLLLLLGAFLKLRSPQEKRVYFKTVVNLCKRKPNC